MFFMCSMNFMLLKFKLFCLISVQFSSNSVCIEMHFVEYLNAMLKCFKKIIKYNFFFLAMPV